MFPRKITQNKTYFAIFLILAGAVPGSLAIFANGLSGSNRPITLAVLVIAILGILTGSVLAFSQLLDRLFKPVVDGLAAEVQDDIQDLKAGLITDTHLMVAAAVLTGLIFSFYVFYFHKLEAAWGAVSVALVTFIAVGLVAWYILRTAWFRLYKNYTPLWVFLIPLMGLIVCIVLGVSQTENRPVLSARPVPGQAGSYNQVGLSDSSGFDLPALGFELPACDSDECGVLYLVFLVVALVILAVVLVIGSAFIPHFWLLSGSVFLTLMALIALHDLRIRPGEKTKIRLDDKRTWLPG